MRHRSVFLAALAFAAALAATSMGRAAVTTGIAKNVPFVIAFRPLHSQQEPYLGQLRLNFHNGIVNGTYTDLSIRPGSPFANAHNLAVSGGVSGSHITLVIGRITFRGTPHGNGMSGSTTLRGAIYEWAAEQGTPASEKGKHPL